MQKHGHEHELSKRGLMMYIRTGRESWKSLYPCRELNLSIRLGTICGNEESTARRWLLDFHKDVDWA